MDPIERLTELFVRFPGIGPRQARRFAYFLLRQDSGWIDGFVRDLTSVRKLSAICAKCHRRYVSPEERASVCPICADAARTKEILMVVEKEVDLESIEKSKAYQGQYFVLGAAILPLEEQKAEPVVKMVSKRIEELGTDGLKEVILALSATADGDDTAAYLKERLHDTAEKSGTAISMLGRGLSTGSEIEYIDSQTLKDALSRRVKVD